ncbi:hypothetical protein AVEN_12195-1, partial [Araneus ventricosus]
SRRFLSEEFPDAFCASPSGRLSHSARSYSPNTGSRRRLALLMPNNPELHILQNVWRRGSSTSGRHHPI